MAQIRVEPDARSFRDLARALDDEADGREIRQDIVAGLTEILEEVRNEQRSGLMAMSTGGLPHAGESLREAISSSLVVDVRPGTRSLGARVRAERHGMPRNFRNAPKRTNAHQWRHRVYGRDVWVTQVSGAENWFDDPILRHGARFRAAARRVLENAALRIDRKT